MKPLLILLLVSLAACQRSETSASSRARRQGRSPDADRRDDARPRARSIGHGSGHRQLRGARFLRCGSERRRHHRRRLWWTSATSCSKARSSPRLDDRDATLRLDQARAAQQQAEASVRQAQSKIGLGQNQTFDPNTVPEVLGAKAAYESAVAQQKTGAGRCAALRQSGQYRRRVAQRLRQSSHAGGDRRCAGERNPPGIRSDAERRPSELSGRGDAGGFAARIARATGAGPESLWPMRKFARPSPDT